MRRQSFLLFRIYRFQDTKAYAELYDLYYTRIRRFVFFKVPEGPEVDEVTAEVFLRGWEYMTSSRVDHAGALFYRIARNLIADYYRKRQEEISTDQIVELPDRVDLASDVADKEEAQALILLLRELKEEYREILHMRYLDEMSVKEISQILEKTPNHVRVNLHRARQALKAIANE
jgi:RNA polymerase sigma-70 factor, ECF subfamily